MGMHIVKLTQMFPDAQFHLYDTNTFDEGLQAINTVTLYHQLFTDKDAIAWQTLHKTCSSVDLIFVSDIRSTVPDKRSHVSLEAKQADDWRVEQGVMRDMEDQARWVKLMKPQAALLKFRPPYAYDWSPVPQEYTYLPGDILLPVWGPKHTTECRLDVDLPGMRQKKNINLNIKQYESVMAYFNAAIRPSNYDRQMEDAIWTSYKKKFEASNGNDM